MLGSGWGEIVSLFEIDHRICYADIPFLGAANVEGHQGELLLARYCEKRLLIFSGRRHLYEVDSLEPIKVPVYLTKMAGARHIILTNAAGSLHPENSPGSLFLIEDHINDTGTSILAGEHHSFWGARFPDMTCVYDLELRRTLERCARDLSIDIKAGVYAAVQGPCYETPAEVRKLQVMGADAVGMSTVHEATLAHAAGLRVCGLSCLSNLAAGLSGNTLSHEEVIAQGSQSGETMKALIGSFFRATSH